MKLKAWITANNQQANTPNELVRVLVLQVAPDTTGGNPNITGGKIGGQLQLSNITPELAAQFSAGQVVEIAVTAANP